MRRIFKGFLIAFLIFGTFVMVSAAGEQFNYNFVLIEDDVWALNAEATVDGGSIQVTGTNTSEMGALFELTDSDLLAAIDGFNIDAEFSIDVAVSGVNVANPVVVKVDIGYGATENDAFDNAISAQTCTATHSSDLDESYTLVCDNTTPADGGISAGNEIPSGTRFVGIFVYMDTTDSDMDVTFTNASFQIVDAAVPTIGSSFSTAWVSDQVEVTLTATDDVALKGIYNSSGVLVSSTSPYVFDISENGTYSYYSLDYSGQTSNTIDVVIDNIDNINPNDIVVPTVSETGWTSDQVTIQFPELTTPVGQTPEHYEVSKNGGAFVETTSGITVVEQGEVTWEFKIVDGVGNESSNTVIVTTRFDNTAPTIDSVNTVQFTDHTDYSVSYSENESSVTVLKYAEGTQTQAFFVSSGISILADPNFTTNTPSIFTVYVEDEAGNYDLEVIDAVNMLPTLSGIQDVSVNEDQEVEVELIFSDIESVASGMTVLFVSDDESVILNGAGYDRDGVLYINLDPITNQFGVVNITVTMTDEGGDSDSATFTVTVNSVNDAPIVGVTSGIQVNEDSFVTIDVVSIASDIENSPLSVFGLSNPVNGSVSESNGVITYTPDPGYVGNDTFTYSITDGEDSTQGTVTVVVNNVNDTPVAMDDVETINEDVVILIDVLSNDSDPDVGIDLSETLTVSIHTAPTNGSVQVINNEVEYTPNENYNGVDSFIYTVTDKDGLADTATVDITINPINDTPTVSVVSGISVLEDSTGNTFTFTVSDVETSLSELMVQVVSTNQQKISNNNKSYIEISSGVWEVTFDVTPDAEGTVNLNVIVSDGVLSSSETVIVSIEPENDAPIASDDTPDWTVLEDQTVQLDFNDLLENDIDFDADSLSVSGVQDVSNGSFVLINSGLQLFNYIPEAEFSGEVTFTYFVTDGELTDSGLVTFEVTNVNDAPELTLSGGNVYSIDENSETDLNFSVYDIDSVSLTVSVKSTNETLIASDSIVLTNLTNGNFQIHLDPANYQAGTTNLEFTVSDGNRSTTVVQEFTVNDIQDAPIAVNVDYQVYQGSNTYIVPTYNDYDYDGDDLSIVSYSNLTHGTLELHENGYIYKAPFDYEGTVTFDYIISDGFGNQDTATVSILVRQYIDQDPVISTMSDFDIMQDATGGPVSFTVSYPSNIISVSASSNDEGLIQDNNLVISGGEGSYQLTFTLEPGVNGDITVTVLAEDQGNTGTETFVIHILDPDDYPEFSSVSDNVLENSTNNRLDIDMYNPEDSDLTYVTDTATLGTISSGLVGGDLAIYYTPTADLYGTDNFTITFHDGSVNRVVNYTVNVMENSTAPEVTIVQSGIITIVEETSGFFDIVVTDIDTPLESIIVTTTAMDGKFSNGNIDVITVDQASGLYRITFVPNDDAIGSSTIRVNVNGGTTTYVTKEINITNTEDAPTVVDDLIILNNGSGSESTLIDVITNDYDVDLEVVTISGIITLPNYGTAVVESGQIRYTRTEIAPNDESDTFVYLIRDAAGNTDSGIVTILANGFIVNNDTKIVAENDSVTFNADIDNPGNLDLSVVSDESTDGTLTWVNNAGVLELTYTPNSDFTGQDQFEYIVSNGYTTRSGLITINVTAIPDIVSVSGVTTVVEDSTNTLTVVVSDDDSPMSSLNVSVYSTNTGVISNNRVSVSTINEASGIYEITFLPNSQQSGSTDLVIEVDDGYLSSSQSVTITVTPEDDAPVVSDDSVTTIEDVSVSVNLIPLITDVDSDIEDLSVSGVMGFGPSNGEITIIGKTVYYSPDLNFYGVDQFTVRVYSTAEPTSFDDAVITVNVTPINDNPYLTNLPYYVYAEEDGTVVVEFDALDVEDSNLTYSISSSNTALVTNSGLSIITSGLQEFLYVDLEENAFGTTVITIHVEDTEGGSIDKDLNLVVNSVNDLPIANDDSDTVVEDHSITIDVISNDSDIEDDASLIDQKVKQVVSVTQPANGTVVNNNDGTLTYTPNEHYYGVETFTYVLADSNNAQVTATVTVTVTGENDAPVADDDEATTNEDEVVIINLFENDEDYDSDLFTITSIDGSTLSESITYTSGVITYTPIENANGIDTFTYTISDGNGGTDTATVTVEILEINDATIVSSNVGNTINGSGMWAFDEDTRGDFQIDLSDVDSNLTNLIISVVSSNQTLVPDTSIQVVTIDSGLREIQLTPAANVNGLFQITVSVSDGIDTTIEVYDVEIVSINDIPTISILDFNVSEDSSRVVYATGTDVEDETLTFTLTGAASHGTVVVETDGEVTYTPTTNYNGSDTFTVRVEDSDGGWIEDTVTITVTAVQDNPVAQNDSATIDENNSVTIAVLTNDTDNDVVYGDSFTIDSFTQPSHGTVVQSGLTLIYTPANDNNNDITFNYTMEDSAGNQDTATVSITINSINNPPKNGNDTYNITEDDSSGLFDVLANDDPDMDESLNESVTDSLTLTSIDSCPNGTCTIESNQLRFEADENFNGTINVLYTVTDSDFNSVQFTATFNVASVNDDPIISDVSNKTSSEDVTVSGLVALFDVEAVDASSPEDLVTTIEASGDIVDSVSIIGSGLERTWYVVPKENRIGTTTITITVTDANGAEDTDSFTVTFNQVNDIPVAQNDSGSTDENTIIYIDVLGDDDEDLKYEGEDLTLSGITDANGTSYGTFEIVTLSQGTVVTLSDGTTGPLPVERQVLKYIPNSGLSDVNDRIEVLNYTMYETGSIENSSSAQVTITITNINDAPVITITEESVTVNEEVSAVLVITVTDEEDGNDTLTVTLEDITDTILDLTPEDSLVLNVLIEDRVEPEGRDITIVPRSNQHGSAEITLKVTDSNGATATDMVTFNVTPVNDSPVAGNDSYTIDEDTVTIFDVLVNDDIDANITSGTVLDIVATTAPSHGSVNIVSGLTSVFTKRIEYTPDQDYYGPDSFTYTVRDEHGQEAIITVSVTVTAVNDSPIIYTSGVVSVSTPEETPYTFTIFADDVDDENSGLTILATSSRQVIARNSHMTFTYIGIVSGGVHDGKAEFEVTVAPYKKYNGSTDITFTVEDDEGFSEAQSSAVIELQVSFVNDAPVAFDDAYTISEGASLQMDVLVNDTDADIGTDYLEELHVASVTYNGDKGTFTIINNSGLIQFVPAEEYLDFNGEITFEYEVGDLAGATNSGLVTITINQVNDAPVAVNDTITVDEDNDAVVSVLNNDSDVDMDGLLNVNSGLESISIVPGGFSGVDNGSVSIVGDTVVFTPDENWNGTETFTYTITDVSGVQVTANITVTVTPINDVPDANPDSASTNEDSGISIFVLANDYDTDSDDFNDGPGKNNGTFTITHVDDQAILDGQTVNVTDGTVTLTSGVLTFNPTINYHGDTSFTYRMKNEDNTASTNTTVSVEVNAVNDTPTISNTNSGVTVLEDGTIEIDIQPLLSDVEDGSGLTITASGVNEEGTLTGSITVSGLVITYSPTGDYNGTTTITYTVTDGGDPSNDTEAADMVLESANGTITVTVTPVEDDPTANNDTASVFEDNVVTIDVLENDTDIDSSTTYNQNVGERNANDFTILEVNGEAIVDGGSGVGVANGTVELVSGVLVFTPDEDYHGVTTFSYLMDNDDGNTDSATVTVTVNAVNDTPTISNTNSGVTVLEDGTIEIDIQPLLSDVEDGSGLTITASGVNEEGTLTGSITVSGLVITYSPTGDYNGTTTITYTVTDGGDPSNDTEAADMVLESANGTITVTVTPVEDDPTANNDTASVFEDNVVTIDVLENDTDIDSSTTYNQNLSELNSGVLTITEINGQAIAGGVDVGNGIVTSSGTGIVFTPDINWNGVETFNYTIENADGLESSGIVTVTVTPVNDQPNALDGIASTNEDSGITILLNDLISDIEDIDSNLSIVSSGITNGTGTISISGQSIIYTPAENFNGTTEITFIVEDTGDGVAASKQSREATITVTVNPINDQPNASDGVASTNEDSGITILLNNLISDVEDIDSNLTIVSSGITNGTGTISISGQSIIYTPAENFNGTAEITFIVEDTGEGATTSKQSREATITITVNPVNDAPEITEATVSINENVLTGTEVHTVVASDIESAITYVIADGSNGLFAIDSSGVITTSGVINYEENNQYNLVIEVSDGVATTSGVITVNINDLNEVPTLGNSTVSVNENSGLVTLIDLDATDPEDDDLTYSLDDTFGGLFNINSGTGEIKIASSANYEVTNQYILTVGVTDGALSTQAAVTVNINDINETPSLGNYTASVSEESGVSTVVITVTGTDVDAGEILTYSILSGADGKFSINNSGVISIASELDYETTSGYSVVVQVEDASGLTDSGLVSITVTNGNDAPVLLDATINVDETYPVGAYVGILNATDADGDPITYVQVGGGEFIVDSSGVVTVNTTLDYDVTTSYIVIVEVTDGVETSSGTITIDVDDIVIVSTTSGITYTSGLIDGQVGVYDLSITYPVEGITNYYSVDQGKTWVEYTSGLTSINVDTVYMKSTTVGGETDITEFNRIVEDSSNPIVTNIPSGTNYDSVTPVVTDMNNITATLNGSPYTIGTAISATGTYELVVVDAAGNQTSVTFTISRRSSSSSASSTPISIEILRSNMVGESTIILEVGSEYIEPGFDVLDYDLTDLSNDYTLESNLDVDVVGVYTLIYTFEGRYDSVEFVRTVEVVDTTAPEFVRNTVIVDFGDPINIFANDNYDGLLEATIEELPTEIGTHKVQVTLSDSSGNEVSAEITIIIEDNEKPILTINGESEMVLEFGEPYVELGVTITDDSATIVEITGNVGTEPGEYVITYTVTDNSGNTTVAARTVTVKEVDRKKKDIDLAESGTLLDSTEKSDFVKDKNYLDEEVIWFAESVDEGTYVIFDLITSDIYKSLRVLYRPIEKESYIMPTAQAASWTAIEVMNGESKEVFVPGDQIYEFVTEFVLMDDIEDQVTADILENTEVNFIVAHDVNNVLIDIITDTDDSIDWNSWIPWISGGIFVFILYVLFLYRKQHVIINLKKHLEGKYVVVNCEVQENQKILETKVKKWRKHLIYRPTKGFKGVGQMRVTIKKEDDVQDKVINFKK